MTVRPSSLAGTVLVPSSKSHTIRALLIAACADGISHIHNSLDSADARSCIEAIRCLGVSVEETARTTTGVSLAVTPPPGGACATPGARDGGNGGASRAGSSRAGARDEVTIDVGNSGTTLYLLTAIATQCGRPVRFDGDASIRGRDAAPLLRALGGLGATIEGGPTAPYTVSGPLAGGRTISLESPTSQYLSALLLTAPLTGSGGPTGLIPTILNERPYVDMTCWWLDRQHIDYHREGYRQFTVASGQRYHPVLETLPGDYSSATFWFVAAALTGNPVAVQGLAPDDVQGDRGVLDILQALGCHVAWSRDDAGVPVVTVRGPLTAGGEFDLNAMPDALPALAVAACFAPEPVTLANVPQARAKETDRIAVMARELNAIGGNLQELPDGLRITPARLTGGSLDSHGDHRVAMAGAIAALGADGPVRIEDAGAAAVTYPSFFGDLARLAPGSIRPEDLRSTDQDGREVPR